MFSVSGFHISEELYESPRTVVFRARRDTDGRSVILKVLKDDYPKLEAVARYKNEYEITSRLSLDHVIRSFQWMLEGKRPVIVIEDFGGKSLKQLSPMKDWMKDWPLIELLEIALAVAQGIGEIHSSGTIHKDINPSNIVLNPQTRELKIIDFGMSTVLHNEVPSIVGPDVLEGTLAYVSPEQTGRMNRVIDYRTDFYSYGVTLYELFTGILPIVGSDPLNLLYRHLTHKPIPASEVDSRVPQAVSDIIAKLLSKTAEDRYQSAWGIVADLNECIRQLRKFGKIERFLLGTSDVPAHFQPSQKLYGRRHEVEEFSKAFERVSHGGRELVVVAGYSGIGKTRLVHEVFKPLTQRRGYFISGKFDQVQRNIPYSALTKAFQELVRQLLSESEERLQYWRTSLIAALGQSGQVITEVIPEIELIVGQQPPVPSLPPLESKNRFNLVFQKFIRVFYQSEHPLVIFLDDLQWGDLATLKLLEVLMTDEETKYLFLVGAYRDNEVGGDHPLIATIDRLSKHGSDVKKIVLAPLELPQVTEFISDTLYCARETGRPLAELVQSKSGGNPFFVGQFLQSLYQEGLIRFESDKGNGPPRWNWDLEKIKSADITDNVVELMIQKLKKMPKETTEVLSFAACLGSQFDLDLLASIHGVRAELTYEHLFPAIREGMVFPISELELFDKGSAQGPLVFPRLKFLHDRVQQAAYALIGNDVKPKLHLRIGRLMHSQFIKDGRTELIFKVVDHLNRGRLLLERKQEKIELASLNLEAARRAKDSGAYGAALRYLEEGMDTFKSDWANHYDLTLSLHSERADAEYLNGNYQSSEKMIEEVLKKSERVLDRADVYTKLIIQRTMLGKYNEAIHAAGKALDILGMGFPSENELQSALDADVAEIERHLGGKPVSSLIDLPQMKDPRIIVVMRILNVVHAPIYFTSNFRFYSWALSRMTLLSLQHGDIPESAKGYASFGNTLGVNHGKYQTGYDFGLLGLKVAEKYNNSSLRCKVCFSLGAFLNHWVHPIVDAETFNEEGRRAGMESGELQYVGYILSFSQTVNRFHRGENLEQLLEDIEKYLVFTRKAKHNLSTDIIMGMKLIASQLVKSAGSSLQFDVDELTENKYFEICDANRSFPAICFYNVQKAFTLYLMGRPEEALTCIEKASSLLGYVHGVLSEAELCFAQSLIYASLWSTANESQKKPAWKQLEANRMRLEKWAENCPENFLHMCFLVNAEIARISGKSKQAFELYDRAIASAGERGFIQNEALANELAGRFWIEQGKEDFALIYLRKARLGYKAWGAKSKEAELGARFPALRAEQEVTPSEFSLWTEKISAANLDLTSVLKASQAISRELGFSKLLDRLMQVMMENAGADRGSLVLSRKGRLVVAASNSEKTDRKTVLSDDSVEESTEISRQIIHYTARTQEVVVRDFTSDSSYANDSHLAETRPKSVLCVPILHQHDLIGVLYLENKSVAGAFSPARVEVLKILSAQAAISLQNSYLLSIEKSARAASEEAERRTSFFADTSGILTESLEYNEVLNRLARLVVSRLSDWCVIDMIENGEIRRIAGAHADPRKQLLLEELQMRYPPGLESPHPSAQVLRTGQPILMPDVSEDLLRAHCVDERHMSLIRQVGTHSFIAVPLIYRGKTAGVLSLGSAVLSRRYGRVDLELAMEVANRAAVAIENALLYQKAQKSVRMRDDFITVASHELRTPLAVVSLQVHLIKRILESIPSEFPQRESLLSIVHKCLSRVGFLEKLFENLLDASKISGGTVVLDRHVTDFSKLVRDTVAHYDDAFKKADCELSLKVEDGVDGLWDRLKLEQVVVNLLTNALRYGAGKSIDVSLARENGKAKFKIRDHGVGISKEDQEKIFKRFERGSSIIDYGGFGLGLFISQEIISAHGGSIRVESEKGQGATFIVELPLSQINEALLQVKSA